MFCWEEYIDLEEVKASFEKRSLNAPKMASSAEVWRRIVEEAAGAEIGLHRQRVLSAGKKMVKFWPSIKTMVDPILQNLSFYQGNAQDESSSDLSDDEEEENLPFKAIQSVGKGKKRAADDEEEEEEEEEEEKASSEMSFEDGDNDDAEEELCAELISSKSKATAAAPPKKKGRQSAPKKQYVIPGELIFCHFCLLSLNLDHPLRIQAGVYWGRGVD